MSEKDDDGIVGGLVHAIVLVFALFGALIGVLFLFLVIKELVFWVRFLTAALLRVVLRPFGVEINLPDLNKSMIVHWHRADKREKEEAARYAARQAEREAKRRAYLERIGYGQ